MKTFISFSTLIVATLVSLSSFGQETYKADAILTAPVSYSGIANFLEGTTTAANQRNTGENDIESPLFGAIQGSDSVCAYGDPVTYSVAITTDGQGNPLQFFWFVPADWVIVSGQSTNQLTVIPGMASGQVAVFAVGYCICSYSCKEVVSEDCNVITPLPVELMSFNAARAQSAVILNWSTASEKNNEAFVIERSNDGRTFSSIGKVAGNGNSDRVINYTFSDTRPMNEVTYYRMKQIDTDGKFEISAVRSVERAGNISAEPAKVYPNPTAGLLKIEMPANTSASATVSIVSATGQTVFSGSAASISGANSQIDMSRFTSGLYILNINSGNNLESVRITKL
ncbi:MAG: T9SS type A sorting domain-containing protein [Sphingobacteriales bacterium]|nr:MAG: T9SS type A sorting domain-containing protein [Sphingobacteriales bacterium]